MWRSIRAHTRVVHVDDTFVQGDAVDYFRFTFFVGKSFLFVSFFLQSFSARDLAFVD